MESPHLQELLYRECEVYMPTISNNIIKYPGGKINELPIIMQCSPTSYTAYYEPFVGGGSVFLALSRNVPSYINDKSTDLMYLYSSIKSQDINFYETLKDLEDAWRKLDGVKNSNIGEQLSDIYILYKHGDVSKTDTMTNVEHYISEHKDDVTNFLQNDNIGITSEKYIKVLTKCIKSKFVSMKKSEEKTPWNDGDIIINIVTIFKASYYTCIRDLYNECKDLTKKGYIAALYLYLRIFCYSSMFRFNSHGDFNVPYGGIGYNNSSQISNKISTYTSEFIKIKFNQTEIFNLDYMDFFKIRDIESDAFMFLDPPYDSEFNTYDNNVFDKEQQIKLSNYLIHECPCKFMLIIKKTDFIQELYPQGTMCVNNRQLFVTPFEKTYNVNFMNRNDKDVTHLMITNYNIQKCLEVSLW